MKLQTQCPKCEKALVETSRFMVGSEILKTFKCGHAFADRQLEIPSNLDFTSVDGSKTARPYQKDGVEFIVESLQNGGGCVLADQMRLGKTPQSLIAAKNLPNFNSPDFAVLVLVRAANIWQWVREIKTWCSALPNSVWVIDGTKGWIPAGFKFYVCSMDTFARRGTCKSCKHQYHEEDCKKCEKSGLSCSVCVPAGDAMSDQLLEFGFKLCIVDEAHSFKNTDSQRSQALTAFLKEIERSETVNTISFTCPLCKHGPWEETVTVKALTTYGTSRVSKTTHCPACFAQVQSAAVAHLKVSRNCGVVMLTGTPIKNRADEYFVPLNLVAPELFPSLASFRRNWIDESGKRIRSYRFDDFKATVAPYVLRREKQDVYTDLPKFNRIFTPITISDERLKKAYNRVIDTIEESMGDRSNFSYFSTIGELQQLRQICGLAKVNWSADYAETFLEDSGKQKLAIGVHHHSVRDAIRYQLDKYGTLLVDGTTSPTEKDRICHRYFEHSPEQLLVLGMMAAKEGLELVYIDTALVIEREWSSADEEQFEYRFFNPDKGFLAKRGLENKTTNVEYVIAKGTIDEFFYNLVEEKRQIFGETLGSEWSVEADSTSFQQLMEQTVANRL